MAKQQLSAEQKRLDTDIWIIALVTLGVFLFYATTGKQLMSFVANSNISVVPRLLLNAGVQFGVAGLGITIVCILLCFFIRSVQWLSAVQYFNY